MKHTKCLLFAGGVSESLAKKVVAYGGMSLGGITHHQFPSGEWHCQFKDNIRGEDVFLLQSTIQPCNDNLMQLLIMADAARRASAGRITAILPYMGYSRQDRKDKSRVPISAKLVMDILAASGINRIVTMDLHAPQIAGFTNLPFDHLHFRPSLIDALKGVNIDVVVAPDIGAVKRATEFSEKMKKDFAFIAKKRTGDSTVSVTQFVGNVKDKDVLIVDDLTESAGTLVAASKRCKKEGAKSIRCAVTHGCLSKKGLSKLKLAEKKGLITQFYCSDTATDGLVVKDHVTIVSVAKVFNKAIRGIHNNTSISSLFQ